MSWVAYWLNILLQQRLLTIKHVLVQAIIAMIYLLLMPQMSNWLCLPALKTFACILSYISKGKVYLFTCGKSMYGKGRLNESRVEIVNIDLMPPNNLAEPDCAALHLSMKPWLQRVLQPGTLLSLDSSSSSMKLSIGDDEIDWDWNDATFEVKELFIPNSNEGNTAALYVARQLVTYNWPCRWLPNTTSQSTS